MDYNNINKDLRASRSAYHFKVILGGKNADSNESDTNANANAHGKSEGASLRVLKGGRPDNVSYTQNANYERQVQPYIAQVDKYTKRTVEPASLKIDRASVVVVDENLSVLQKVGEVLKSCGCDVRKYSKPFDALAAIKEEPCNILITAEKTKQMSGVVLAELVKKSGNARNVILLTESAQSEAMELLRKELIDGFICKPVSTFELMYKVNSMIDVTDKT